MQCEDNSKLRTPLSEVCQTTDIGCVPIVDGKPGCAPQPDELPIALDPKTITLWLFSCKTREWVAFQKFQMCQLNALNLENITNICDVLQIGVNYAGSGECQQGTVTLKELAERILECIQLETKIITIGQGDGNKVKISIDGLPLDPVYVQGRNIWSEGGSGTESDPLIVATYDPICEWPTKTQAQVDAANTKHLGACLDGEMARVPFPKQPCEYPQKTQEQVDTATEKNLIACVDGEEAKVPYPKFQPPVCESDQLTLEQAKAKGTALTLVGCDNGNTVRIPVSQSGFFDRDYICVPETVGVPNSPPVEGTGPLRVDCSGNLYVWLCDSNKWLHIQDGITGIGQLNPNNVPDICDNLRFKGWFSNNSDPCVQDVWMTLQELSKLVVKCSEKERGTSKFLSAEYRYCNDFLDLEEGSLYRARTNSFINDTTARPATPSTPGKYAVINITNNSNLNGVLDIRVTGSLIIHGRHPVSMNIIVSENLDEPFYHPHLWSNEGIITNPPYGNYRLADAAEESLVKYYSAQGGLMVNSFYNLNPGESKTIYIQHFLIFHEDLNELTVDIRSSWNCIFSTLEN